MPHIRALFIENEEVKELLRRKKSSIRQGVAMHTGYELEKIAFIPDMIPAGIADLSDNVLPIEFIIDAGKKCLGKTAQINVKLKHDFAEIIGLKPIQFGIWLRTMTDSDYIEHMPK